MSFVTLKYYFRSCMKCCGKAEETEKLLKDGKDKEKGKPGIGFFISGVDL